MTKKEKITTKDWTYVGEVKKGKPHGKGTIYFFDKKKSNVIPLPAGSALLYFIMLDSDTKSPKKINKILTAKYEGEFKNGNWHGEFKCTNYLPRNKERYFVIQFSNNKILSEMEKIRWPNGDEYFGELNKEDEFHGKGTLTFSDGQTYTGSWKNDLNHGKGIYTWPSGDTYDGDWKNGNEHGKGIYTWHNGNKYIGEYKNGLRHGKGTYTYSDGKKYIGEYKNGLRDGKGTFTAPKVFKYVGEHKKDRFHGKGIMIHYSGIFKGLKEEGIFRKDFLIKNQKIKYSLIKNKKD